MGCIRSRNFDFYIVCFKGRSRGNTYQWLDRLEDVLTYDPDRGRAELRTIFFRERIKVSQDESRKFL